MAAYLIDYENVKSEGIRGILQLCDQDSVIIFYSHNADTLTFETMDMIFGSKATVRKYKIVRGGKNALDFQLSTYLGYLIHEGKDSCFYIISKDNGFQHVVEFWKRTFNYDGYVYCFPTIADAYAKHRRLDATSAKERDKAIEEDLLALQAAVEEDSQAPVTSNDAAVSASEEPAYEPVSEEADTITEKDSYVQVEEDPFEKDFTKDSFHDSFENVQFEDVQFEDVQFEEDSTEDSVEEQAQSIIITSHEDNFIIETIHDNTAVPSNESSEPTPKPAQIPVFSESLAEKIAAAVPDSWLKVTVVENNVTVHQVPEESETKKPISPVTVTPESLAVSSPKPAVPAPETPVEIKPVLAVAEPEEKTSVVQVSAEPEEKPVAKKKPRQTSKKKNPSPKADSVEKTDSLEKTDSVKKTDSVEEKTEPTAEPEVTSEPTSALPEETTSDDTAKQPRRKSSHHGGRRKKNAPASPAEPETSPVSAGVSEDKEPERKPHHTHTGSSRGRRPKPQKSEAAAFTE